MNKKEREGYRMVLEKSWVSENFRRVSKSRRSKLQSQNLELAKNKARLGISNFEIDRGFESRKPSESFNQFEPSNNNGNNNSKAESYRALD